MHSAVLAYAQGLSLLSLKQLSTLSVPLPGLEHLGVLVTLLVTLPWSWE